MKYFVLLLLICYSASAFNYDGWKVINVKPKDQAGGRSTIRNIAAIYGLMPWGVDHQRGLSYAGSAESIGVVSPLFLQEEGSITMTNDNINASIIAELEDISYETMEWNKFNTWDVIKNYIDSLETNTSHNRVRTDVEKLGNTSEGRPLYLVRLAKMDDSGDRDECVCRNKGAIVVIGGINAHEWISSACSLYLINELKTKYQDNTLLNEFDWYIMPIVNPDGYAYTFDPLGDRLWKKNRRKSKLNTACYGVDINKNFAYYWNESTPSTGGSLDPCHKYGYIGTDAFSESESKAIKEVLFRKVNTTAFLSIKALGEYIVYPWAYGINHVPPYDSQKLHSAAMIAADAMKSAFNTEYSVGPKGELLGHSTGDAIDYAKGVLKIPYAFDIELRDDDKGTAGFLLPASEIIPTCTEMMEGIKALIGEISNQIRTNKTN